MSVTLRDFIAQREGEIRDQMKALKTELRELQLAKGALEAPGNAPGLAASSAGPTIKEMALDVLQDATAGMNSGEIQAAIKEKFSREIDRTSLSPQLSRLKADEEVVLTGERWFTKAQHQRLMAEIFEDTEMEVIRSHDL
jgi:sugar-specific transcriptional regulator TrmB